MQALKQFQDVFLDYLQDHSFRFEPKELYEPVDYILQLGGKRMRPVLLLMSHFLFNNKFRKALPAAYAVEIFHNFTLLHDDIMDDAPLRRGQPTVHEKWDINTGILSGDVMLIYAYEYLLKLEDHSRLPEILQIFNRTAIEVCEGQQLDVNFEQRNDVTIEEYLKMIELKTSVLLAGAMRIGAITAGASVADAEHIQEFGRNIGIAFQLQDDLLDTFGDPAKFGKKVGGDIVNNKKTYLILKAMEIADELTRDELSRQMSIPTSDEVSKISAVTETLRRLDIPALTEAVKTSYQKKAFDHLEQINAPQERKQPLIDIAEYLLGREV